MMEVKSVELILRHLNDEKIRYLIVGFVVPILRLPKLIEMKEEVNREIDRIDVDHLKKIGRILREETID